MPQIPLSVKLLITGLCVAVICYGFMQIYDAGAQAQKDADAVLIAKANARYEAEKQARQEDAKKDSTKDNAETKAELAQLRAQNKALRGQKPVLPALAADCKFDKKRIDWANAE
jgi:hypothetical protein